MSVGTVNVYNQKVGYSTFACRISLAENFSFMFFVMDFGSFWLAVQILNSFCKRCKIVKWKRKELTTFQDNLFGDLIQSRTFSNKRLLRGSEHKIFFSGFFSSSIQMLESSMEFSMTQWNQFLLLKRDLTILASR